MTHFDEFFDLKFDLRVCNIKFPFISTFQLHLFHMQVEARFTLTSGGSFFSINLPVGLRLCPGFTFCRHHCVFEFGTSVLKDSENIPPLNVNSGTVVVSAAVGNDHTIAFVTVIVRYTVYSVVSSGV